jgi:thiosulfate/3-mercaptopyruvate sulfurtransferase
MNDRPAHAYTTLIDHRRLAACLDDPDWRVIDCRFDLAATARGETAYREAHIPGAHYAHLDRDLSSPVTPESGRHPLPELSRLCAWLGSLGIGPGIQVVVYDDSGGSMAVRLWWLLRWLGHDSVALLDGGWQAWVTAGEATTADDPRDHPAVDFPCTPRNRQIVTSDDIERQLEEGNDAIQLLDARTGERFRGEAEPIDPVAGHIPGAINLPLQRNLDAQGWFRPAGELRTLYLDALQGHPSDRVAVMCGSGVTACHNLLAMEIAGLPGGRLYAGSWSEWIRDPGRPVALGA